MKTGKPDHGSSPPNGPVVTGAAELDAPSRHHSSSPPPSVPDYDLLRCIGRGSYGDVWFAQCARTIPRGEIHLLESRLAEAHAGRGNLDFLDWK
jgi:hypothetical protein